MATTGANIETRGLTELVTALKGPVFKDVNNALRAEAGDIAKAIIPIVQRIVAESPAPQAQGFVNTVRVKRDRVPCVAIGAVNPKFSKSFTRKGAGPVASKNRRGAMAHGIMYGSKGGRKPKATSTGKLGWAMDENYYKIPRNDEPPLERAVGTDGLIIVLVEAQYRDRYLKVLHAHGFPVKA